MNNFVPILLFVSVIIIVANSCIRLGYGYNLPFEATNRYVFKQIYLLFVVILCE